MCLAHSLRAVVDHFGLVEDVWPVMPDRSVLRGGRRSCMPVIRPAHVHGILATISSGWSYEGRWHLEGKRGVWVCRAHRAVLTWAQGVLTLVAADDEDAFAEELGRCGRFYGNEQKSRARRAPAMA